MYRFSLSLLNKMDSLKNYSRMFGEDDVKAEVGPDKLSSSDDAGNPNAAWRKRAKQCQCQTVKPMDPNTPVKEDCVRFVCISDTHTKLEQFKNLEIPDGDVLIHAGDFTMQGMPDEVDVVNKYLGTLPHKHKVIIAGNHDITFDLDHVKKNGSRKIWSLTTGMELESRFEHFGVNTVHEMLTDCIYLEDSSVEIYGIKIYGSPWTAGRGSWGFQRHRGSALMKKWNQIPADTDILVTHSPPCGIGDNVNVGVAYKLKRMVGGPAANHVGCVDLLDTVQKRVKPKYHIFGHIHEGYGVTTDGTTTFINASTCTHTYDPSNPAIVFDVPLPAGYSKDQDKKEDGSGKLSDGKKRPRSKDRKRSRSRDRKRSYMSKHDHSLKSKRRRSRSRSKDRKRRRSRDHHRHKDKKSRDRKSSRDEKRSKSRERKDSKSENRKSEVREHKDSTSEKNVTETKSSTDVKCDIKDNKDSKSEGHRKRSRSRDRKDKKKDRRRSRSRHRHRSRSRERRSRDRKKSRSKERKRSRSKDRKRKHRSRSRDSRSRSRHRSRERHSRSRSRERLRSRSPMMGRKLTFKEQMRKEFINASKEMSNQEHKVVSDLDALRKPGEALRPSDLLKGVKLNSGESVTPQMALIQTMAAMHKKAQELTGVEVPKYYNPAAVNPLKYAEQVQKRKLLWSKKTDENQKEKNDHMETQWKSAFVSTEDNKTASKFRKLMGMKGGEGQSSAEEMPEDLQKLSEEQQRKQAELFQRLDQDYQFARMTTHTQRGVGLGFSTTIIDPNHPQNPP